MQREKLLAWLGANLHRFREFDLNDDGTIDLFEKSNALNTVYRWRKKWHVDFHSQWYIYHNNEVKGPFAWRALKRQPFFDRGLYICPAGEKAWLPYLVIADVHPGAKGPWADYPSVQPLKVNSFWGAVAYFFILRCFSFYLFQAFIFSVRGMAEFNMMELMMLIFALLFSTLFLLTQAYLFNIVGDYLRDNWRCMAIIKRAQLPRLVVAIGSAGLLALFYLGYYPGPKQDFSYVTLFLFELLCLVFSLLAVRIEKSRKNVALVKEETPHIGLIIGAVFFIAGLAISQVATEGFYVIGSAGATVFILSLSPILLEEDEEVVSRRALAPRKAEKHDA